MSEEVDLVSTLERIAVEEEAILDSVHLTLKSHGEGFDRQNGQATIDALRNRLSYLTPQDFGPRL